MVNPSGGGEVNGGGGETVVRSIPTPFLTKTYQLVDDPAFDDIISWNEDGSAFVVRNPNEFARDLLPKYFKHNNFSSFVRQLNTYGFRKIVSDRWEFSNDCFKKGEKCLLGDIHRRKVGGGAVVAAAVAAVVPAPPPVVAAAAVVAVVPPEHVFPRITVSGTDSADDQVISSTCSPRGVIVRDVSGSASGGSGLGSGTGTNAELIGENKQLRKDNLQLNKELCHMKSMCSNIYSMMASYSNSCNNSSNNNGKSSETVDTPMPTAVLDLMPARECTPEPEEIINTDRGVVVDEMNAILFGVSIGMKRGREEANNDGAAAEEVEDEQHEKMIKVEPVDVDDDDDDDDKQESHV